MAIRSPEECRRFYNDGVMRLNQPILHVSHDEEDGAWQFHTGAQKVSAATAMVVALAEIVERDPSICDLADLPCGWFADRDAVGSPWTRVQR